MNVTGGMWRVQGTFSWRDSTFFFYLLFLVFFPEPGAIDASPNNQGLQGAVPRPRIVCASVVQLCATEPRENASKVFPLTTRVPVPVLELERASDQRDYWLSYIIF